MNSKQLIDTKRVGQGAIVVGIYRRPLGHIAPNFDDQCSYEGKYLSRYQPHPKEICELDLDELSALLLTLNIPTAHRVIQERNRTGGAYFLGRGKLEEITELAQQSCAGLIAVDGSLSGSQMRAMERLSGCQVIDREGVILEIFSNHAQTSVARLQVEMARWQYLMPRLVGAWTHFSRQTGGVRSKGMGEKQIEIDRRIGRARIAKLRKKLAHIEVEAAEQRKLRKDQMKVALVGYTNSGKTTLMHGLTPSKVTGEDQLFATLSAKVKASTPLRQPHILFTDTVGFIGRLPHSLVASFRSTLAETIDADLLVHVIDVSHQRYQWQLETSEQVLTEIGANTKLMIHVFNKIDQLEDSRVLRRSLKKKYPDSYWISAHNQEDVARLAAGIRQHFFARLCSAELQVPASHAELVSQIFEHCIVMRSCYETPGIVEFKVKAMSQALKKLEPIIIHAGGAVELQLSPASSLVQTQNFDGGGEQHEWVPQNAIVL